MTVKPWMGFPAGTGLAHTFINDTEAEVRLLVVGEATRADNRIAYSLYPERRGAVSDWWDDAPQRPLGPHDDMPVKLRAAKG